MNWRKKAKKKQTLSGIKEKVWGRHGELATGSWTGWFGLMKQREVGLEWQLIGANRVRWRGGEFFVLFLFWTEDGAKRYSWRLHGELRELWHAPNTTLTPVTDSFSSITVWNHSTAFKQSKFCGRAKMHATQFKLHNTTEVSLKPASFRWLKLNQTQVTGSSLTLSKQMSAVKTCWYWHFEEESNTYLID